MHYLLGSVLGTAQQVQPDYILAVQHLSIAAERGNPAAADLLASLLIAGKGAARDVPRAIHLYETAAANGFPTAAVALGKLYLAGKFVPQDEARGLAWLDGAAAVNVPSATQLAALARGGSKVSNYQLIPSAEPAKVKVVKYGIFDNPDIPPSFGFDRNSKQSMTPRMTTKRFWPGWRRGPIRCRRLTCMNWPDVSRHGIPAKVY